MRLPRRSREKAGVPRLPQGCSSGRVLRSGIFIFPSVWTGLACSPTNLDATRDGKSEAAATSNLSAPLEEASGMVGPQSSLTAATAAPPSAGTASNSAGLTRSSSAAASTTDAASPSAGNESTGELSGPLVESRSSRSESSRSESNGSESGASSGTTTSGASQESTNSTLGELLAFPGAEGFGRFATGGRGGAVYHVTNLDDAGPGSLRDALSQPNRTVVFDVSGVIRIKDRLVFKSNQTIAGQTAPGGGITVYGNGTSFSGASHTVVRYMRFRMGKIGESGKDTVTAANGHDLIWDHCSLSWGRDGNFDLNQESGEELYNLTLQDSIVAQGLQTHSTGGLVVTQGTSIIRSLYIDNNSRNPKARGTLQFVNNVIYNWVASGYILGDTSGRSDGYMVGNYFIPGPETNGGTLDSPTPEYHIFARDNWYDSNKDGVLNGRLLARGDFGTATWEEAPRVQYPSVRELTATEALKYVRQHAGASAWRDAVDEFVISELDSLGVRGATISDETSLGFIDAIGPIASGAAATDTDRDGMSDSWEAAQHLDANNAEDRNDDADGDGYTNLEEYLSSLVPSAGNGGQE